MNFSKALDALKEGMKVAREGWNGKDMFVKYIPYGESVVGRPTGAGTVDLGSDGLWALSSYLALKTADDSLVPWQPSQTDLLSNDWLVVGLTYD